MNTNLQLANNYLIENESDSLLITNPDNIFYLSGFELHDNTPDREVFLLLSEKENLFITDGRLITHARKVLNKEFSVVERNHHVSMIRIIEAFLKKYNLKKLGFEKNNLTVAEFEKFNKELKGIKLIGTEGFIEKLRLKKNQIEIEKIKKAAEITDRVFSTLASLIRPGKTELELVWKIKTLFNNFRVKEAFEPIVASGEGSAIPHYTSTAKKLKRGELVLFDFGAKHQGYCSDMTRVIFLGKADNKQQKIYQTVLDTQQKAIEQLNNETMKQSHVKASDIDKVARDDITSRGYPSIPHGLGHGVGISIHEDPRLNPKGLNLLSEGMVFTIEPGIYLPSWGGIRIEDLIVWNKDGIINLTKSPKNLIELES